MRDFRIENLVLDAAPLLSTAASSSASALRGLADNFTTTPDVVAEIRDKTSRELFNSTLQVLGLESASDLKQAGGLQVKTPSADSVARVTAFAKLTGDISVLSEADIRVLALTYALEVEQNGLRRIRPAPGKLSPEEQEREDKKKERLAKSQEGQNNETTDIQLEKLSLQESSEEQQPEASTSALPPSHEESPAGEAEHEQQEAQDDDDDDDFEDVPTNENTQDDSEGDSDESDGDGEWITPTNVTLHKSRDLGLFPTLPAHHPDALISKPEKKSKQRITLKVACLTGDFAMQNVALQMGLNVFGVGGQKIKEVKTWVLRCHACFKLCKDPERKFCPSCGNPSLLRTSITYVTPSLENPKGYILHLKANFQYKNRGTQFSIPNPKQGSSNAMKYTKNAEIILREDQKEYQRGLRSADYLKKKSDRAAVKAVREGKSGGTASIFGGWDDPDWTPEMLMGTGGRKGAPPGVRIGKDGLPVIGHGRRNPNEVRKPRK